MQPCPWFYPVFYRQSFTNCLCITVQFGGITLATSGLLDWLCGKIMIAIWKAECVKRIVCLQLELELKNAEQEPARTDRCLKSVKAWNGQMNAEWITQKLSSLFQVLFKAPFLTAFSALYSVNDSIHSERANH